MVVALLIGGNAGDNLQGDIFEGLQLPLDGLEGGGDVGVRAALVLLVAAELPLAGHLVGIGSSITKQE